MQLASSTLPLGAPVQSEVAIVALERGAGWQAAEWRAFAGGLKQGGLKQGLDAVVIAQDSEESDVDFVERVKARVGRLNGARVVAALVLLNEEIGPERVAARRALTEALRSSVIETSGASLTVSAPELPSCPELQHELLGLAGALAKRSCGAHVNVRFTRRRRRREQGTGTVPVSLPAAG